MKSQQHQHRSHTPAAADSETAKRSGRAPVSNSERQSVLRLERPGSAGGGPIPAEVEAPAGAGRPLPPEVLQRLEKEFGRSMADVRIHTDADAAKRCEAASAEMFAQGTHIFFSPGTFAPDTPTGWEQLRHEIVHTLQSQDGRTGSGGVSRPGDSLEQEARALAPTPSGMGRGPRRGGEVLRREVATEQEISETGDWTTADREGKTTRWKNACYHNLMAGNSSHYVQIEERRDFYTWFYEHTVAEGYTTRWALAASVVAAGAHHIAHPGVTTEAAGQATGMMRNDLQGFIRMGNQVIFDDVFPKLRALLQGGPLTGDAAMQWDMQILSEEQAMMDTLYEQMTPEARALMESSAKKEMGFLGLRSVGIWMYDLDEVEEGPHNNGGTVPAFPGNHQLDNVEHRWQYGMMLGDQFTPGGTGFDPSVHTRPPPRPQYTDGTALAAVNTRPNLHMLDGELDAAMGYASITSVENILSSLTEAEKAEFARDQHPDIGRYSSRLAMMRRVSRRFIVGALPATGAARESFLANYDRLRPPHWP